MGKQGAIEMLRSMKADVDYVVANGADSEHEVGASHYDSRGPYVKQYIDECGGDEPVVISSRAPTGLLYWFSGANFTETSVASYWHEYTGGECTRRDMKVDPMDSILSDVVYDADVLAVRSGKVKQGLFSVPCNTFTVSKFKPHARVRPVRDVSHILMRPRLSQHEEALAKEQGGQHTDLILIQRTCNISRQLTKYGGLWVIENPVRRNDPSGPWKRFNSGKFPEHGSLFQMPAHRGPGARHQGQGCTRASVLVRA